jgi:serine-type D-Ala-D-Ala carboxypeptidase (penicillin-binding protein 5/6)
MIKRVAIIAAVVIALGATGVVAIAVWPDRAGEGGSNSTGESRAPSGTSPGLIRSDPGRKAVKGVGPADIGTAALSPNARFALRPVRGRLPIHHRFKHPPLAGILFDVKSGEILWQRHPRLEHPIASLTKMMTALMVAQRDPPVGRVRVSAKAAHTPGSATGLLPRGRKVPLEPLLQALIMISANDAAVALAQHDGGTVRRFVKEMNGQARAMALSCTRFSTPNGLRDRNNYSCPLDLAELARADLANPRIAQIAQTRYAKPHFPIRGKHLYLSNNHYFLQRGLTGLPQARVTGLKTGFTNPAGRCYVTTARIGSHHLGVVLIHSPDPITQVPALLQAGFEKVGAIAPGPKPGGSKLTPGD